VRLLPPTALTMPWGCPQGPSDPCCGLLYPSTSRQKKAIWKVQVGRATRPDADTRTHASREVGGRSSLGPAGAEGAIRILLFLPDDAPSPSQANSRSSTGMKTNRQPTTSHIMLMGSRGRVRLVTPTPNGHLPALFGGPFHLQLGEWGFVRWIGPLSESEIFSPRYRMRLEVLVPQHQTAVYET
jgi:hypothetical protein